MKNYLPKSLDAYRARISVYALERFARGLPGLPTHPRNRNQIGMVQIGRDTSIPFNIVRRIRPHIEALADRYGKADVMPTKRAEAVNRIKSVYDGRPLPVSRSGITLSQIAIETGMSFELLRSPECIAVIKTLIDTNGIAPPLAPDLAAEIATLEAYAADLMKNRSLLPWNNARGKPDFAAIARTTGIPRARLKVGRLGAEFERIFRDVPREVGETIQAQTVRLTSFVDEAIAGGRPIQIGPKGICYKKIAEEMGIPSHRLLQTAAMAAQIKRWLAASRDMTAPTEATSYQSSLDSVRNGEPRQVTS